MNERIRESLSAFMDGEADELEVQRLMSVSDDTEVRATWARYHVARSVLQEKAQGSSMANLDISSRVRIELDAGPEPEARKRDGGLQAMLKPVASFALAASVAGAVVVGTQWMNAGNESLLPTVVSAPIVASKFSAPVGSWGGVPVTASIRTSASARPAGVDREVIYNALARERLQRFMLHNAEHAALNNSQGMMPFARVASTEKK
ncbi:MAG: sigma-E factor negative regulatory protein RseA [Halieaceae bacterium]|jgi:sigma-E factor negative regulatory protein RseA